MSRLACETIGILQWIDAALAFFAALFWLWASLVKVPDSIDHFIPALNKQSRVNAAGAVFAAAAAALQGFLVIQPTCISF